MEGPPTPTSPTRRGWSPTHASLRRTPIEPPILSSSSGGATSGSVFLGAAYRQRVVVSAMPATALQPLTAPSLALAPPPSPSIQQLERLGASWNQRSQLKSLDRAAATDRSTPSAPSPQAGAAGWWTTLLAAGRARVDPFGAVAQQEAAREESAVVALQRVARGRITRTTIDRFMQDNYAGWEKLVDEPQVLLNRALEHAK